MARKRTNLAVAVDVPTAAEMLRIADQARAAADTSAGAGLHAAQKCLCRCLASSAFPTNPCNDHLQQWC